jgi:glucose-6-phosphate 1-epimerase
LSSIYAGLVLSFQPIEEHDRIYTCVKIELIIDDTAFDRQIRISSTGSKTGVVWNRRMETTAAMSDLKDDNYQYFLCVKASSVATGVVQIPPGS